MSSPWMTEPVQRHRRQIEEISKKIEVLGGKVELAMKKLAE